MQTTRTLVRGAFLDCRSFFTEWIACSNGSTPDSTWCLKYLIFVRRPNILSTGFWSSLGKNIYKRQEGNQLRWAGICAHICAHTHIVLIPRQRLWDFQNWRLRERASHGNWKGFVLLNPQALLQPLTWVLHTLNSVCFQTPRVGKCLSASGWDTIWVSKKQHFTQHRRQTLQEAFDLSQIHWHSHLINHFSAGSLL